jgi:osmoprotectant transport system substrate-binding protein
MNRLRLLAPVLLALLATAACGSGGLEGETDADGQTSRGSLIVGGANFTEMLIMQQMYAQLLEDRGFDVTVRSVSTRDIYGPALERGQIDVAPEYAGSMADFLNARLNGPDAEQVTSNDVQETVAALRDLAEQAGLVVLEPAKATDQNAFAVTEDVAAERDLTTLSDLGASDQPVVLAAAPDCPERPDCAKGLQKVYDIEISEVLPLGFGSPQTKDAVLSGEAQLGLVGTTDGSLDRLGLVILADDKGLQVAQNLIPVLNADTAEEHPEIADVLNELSATLTTADLARLNYRVDPGREKPADVARAYLEAEGLL